MATTNMHMKFEIEILKQTWLMLRKPCRLRTDGQTDGQGESSIPPPPTSLGGGIINMNLTLLVKLANDSFRVYSLLKFSAPPLLQANFDEENEKLFFKLNVGVGTDSNVFDKSFKFGIA